MRCPSAGMRRGCSRGTPLRRTLWGAWSPCACARARRAPSRCVVPHPADRRGPGDEPPVNAYNAILLVRVRDTEVSSQSGALRASTWSLEVHRWRLTCVILNRLCKFACFQVKGTSWLHHHLDPGQSPVPLQPGCMRASSSQAGCPAAGGGRAVAVRALQRSRLALGPVPAQRGAGGGGPRHV